MVVINSIGKGKYLDTFKGCSSFQEKWERLTLLATLDTCDTCEDTCHVALQMEAEIIRIYWLLARFILITRCPGLEPHLTPRGRVAEAGSGPAE